KSTKIEPKKEKEGKEYEVTGDLTLHGVTKPLTFTFAITGQGKGMKGETRIGGETTFTIKRSDFDVKYGLPDALSDEVELTISAEALKACPVSIYWLLAVLVPAVVAGLVLLAAGRWRAGGSAALGAAVISGSAVLLGPGAFFPPKEAASDFAWIALVAAI